MANPRHPVKNGRKICNKCLIERSEEEFRTKASVYGGSYHGICRVCEREEYMSPEYRARQIAYQKRWRDSQKELNLDDLVVGLD